MSKGCADERELKIAYIAKAIIALILIALAITFGITLFKNTNVGGLSYFLCQTHRLRLTYDVQVS